MLGLEEGGSSSSNHSSEEELWWDWTLVSDASLEINLILEKARSGGFAPETEHDRDLQESLPLQLFTLTRPTLTSTIEAEWTLLTINLSVSGVGIGPISPIVPLSSWFSDSTGPKSNKTVSSLLVFGLE